MNRSNFLTLSLCAIYALCPSCKNADSEKSTDSTPESTIQYESGATPKFTGKLTNPLESNVAFGKELPAGMSWQSSIVTLDPERSIWSSHSLKWDWQNGSELTFDRPIPWNDIKKARALSKHFHTVETACSVWIYNEKPLKDAQLEFQFYSKEKKVSCFPFNLNFSGWRTARVSFDTEMNGKPIGPMDSLKIVAPTGVENGTIWLGDLVMSKIIDSRHRHGDYQVPFVKDADLLRKGHWDPIMYWYELGVNAKVDAELTAADKKAFATLRPVIKKTQKITTESLSKIEENFKKYKIKRRQDGVITGDHIYLLHHLDAAPDNKTSEGHLIKEYTTQMLNVAKRWSELKMDEKASANGKRLAEIYCLMSEHLLDQGFAAGSAQGTMHHFGYNARAWAPSVELMQQPLQEKGLLEPMLQALIWFYNCNKIYDPKSAVADMDYLNTLAASDLQILAIGADNAAKAGRLKQFSKWISQMLSENTAGNKQGFKPDGSLYHHNMHYFGYGIPAITNVVHKIVGPLDGTPFEISKEAYQALKSRYIAASYWAYPYAGFNACGRHPITASGQQMKRALRLLAKSQPGTDATDPELAQIYVKMFGGSARSVFADLKEEPNTPMPDMIVMNHNASFSLNKDGNTVHVKGWGDGIKKGETYKADNRYGRYLGSGSMQIFRHTFDHKSGNEESGWDWSSIPGTTSLLLPHDVLEGGKGFYGKGIKETTHPSGAGTLDGKYGGFLFQTDGSSDPESLTVRKSVFAFGDTLVCLGSNIANGSDKYPTITTLFQTSPLKGSTAELKSSITDNGSWIINSYGIGYFVPEQQSFKTKSGEQTSHHNKTRKETKGYFNKGWIDHGVTVEHTGYQYHVLLNATPEKMEKFKAEYAQRFQVKQGDETVHHLLDRKLDIEAITAFGACQIKSGDTLLNSTTHTCVVLIQRTSGSSIKLSHTNVNIDEIGKISAPATVTLNGQWEITIQDGSCSAQQKDNTTILTFSGVNNKLGITQQITLQKK